MILFFHFICILARYIFLNISNSLNKSKVFLDEEDGDYLSENQSYGCKISKNECTKLPAYENGTLKFFPPVFVQRYETVALVLQDFALNESVKKVVDFGCSELGFFLYLKNIEGVTEILEVDIDSEILLRYSYKAAPLTADYLMGRRKSPIDVYILEGSVAEYDDYLINSDAVIAIELIEHLTSEDFNKLPHNIFYKIKPKIAIFTTPNADFNILFPNFSKFRHEDHKFEWSRTEFFNWTQQILKNYPEYSVKFYGIGQGPEGTENLGCCSQMAVFKKTIKTDILPKQEPQGIHNYKLIKHFEYPAIVDKRTPQEKILHEVQYHAAYLSKKEVYYNYEFNESHLPLTVLKECLTENTPNDEEFLTILQNGGMTLRKENNIWYLVCSETDSNSSIDDGWLNKEISEDFYNQKDLSFENLWSEAEKTPIENLEDFQSARSLGDCNFNAIDKKTFDKYEPRNILNSETKSAPQSCNQLSSPEKLSLDFKVKSKRVQLSNSSKSKIPRIRTEKDRESPVSFNPKLVKTIIKSCSLDSFLENISAGEESYYLNSSVKQVSSLLQKNYSCSSLLSSSFDKGADSGYPFSFSFSPYDLTFEQVDELFTESEVMSKSTSTSPSEVDVLDLNNHRHQYEVFGGEMPVENGDVANNNRDGEGNNVEGLIGQ